MRIISFKKFKETCNQNNFLGEHINLTESQNNRPLRALYICVKITGKAVKSVLYTPEGKYRYYIGEMCGEGNTPEEAMKDFSNKWGNRGKVIN